MNRQEILDYYNIKPKSIKHKGMATIITTDNKKYVLKEVNKNQDFFNYLQLRNFNNFPNIYSSNLDKFQLTDYVEDNNIPVDQRLEDLIYLVSILHTKTTFYKNVDDDYVKEIYAPFTDEEISAKMVELLTPKGTKAKVEIVYQPLEGLHEACPNHRGDWYFSGNYPTPGGVKMVNQAFINYIEQLYQF